MELGQFPVVSAIRLDEMVLVWETLFTGSPLAEPSVNIALTDAFSFRHTPLEMPDRVALGRAVPWGYEGHTRE